MNAKEKKYLLYASTIDEGLNHVFNTGPKTVCTPEDLQKYCLPFILKMPQNASLIAFSQIEKFSIYINEQAFRELFNFYEHFKITYKNDEFPIIQQSLENIMNNCPFILHNQKVVHKTSDKTKTSLSVKPTTK